MLTKDDQGTPRVWTAKDIFLHGLSELRFVSEQDYAALQARNSELTAKLADAKKETECDEQRVADLMTDLDRVGRANDHNKTLLREYGEKLRRCETMLSSRIKEVNELYKDIDRLNAMLDNFT